MLQRFGMNGTEQDGIFFSEAPTPAGVQVLGTVKATKSRQNLSLSVIKSMLAEDARKLGATAVVEFTYGQKSHKWWEQVFTFKWDTESWYGEGVAVLAHDWKQPR